MMRPFTICLHGPESTGKSTLGLKLAGRLGAAFVPEFGRSYCETYGNRLAMDDLVTIAETHDAMTRAAQDKGGETLLLDTDPLMTAVWADMLFGARDPWFAAFDNLADLYLLFDIDLPWIDDGTRMFGSVDDRARFFALSKAELERRGVRWSLVSGAGEARWRSLVDAIGEAGIDLPPRVGQRA